MKLVLPEQKSIEQVAVGKRGTLKYQVYPGNNGALVKRVMENGCPIRAQLWISAPNLQQSHFHFRWAPVSKQIQFDRLNHNFMQIVNHFEGHIELSRKQTLFKNVCNYLCGLPKQCNAGNIFSMMPVQFLVKVNTDTKSDKSIKIQLKN